jgi:hypothetical protein
MNWREFGTGHGLKKVLSWHVPGGIENTHRKHNKGNDLVEIQCRHNLMDFKRDLLVGQLLETAACVSQNEPDSRGTSS